MLNDPQFIVVTAVAVTVLGLSKGGFAGMGMISTPLVALMIGPVAAAGLILPIMIVQDFIAVSMYRRTFSSEILATMIPGAAAGVLLAYLFASKVPQWGVEIMLGLVSLLFGLRQLFQLAGASSSKPHASGGDRWIGMASGLGSGFTSAIAHAGTPPFQIYVLPKRLARDTYVGTSVIFFAALNVMKIPAFAALGQMSKQQLSVSLTFVPLAILSSWLGAKLVRLIDVNRFNVLITIILVGVSVALILQGIEART